MPQKDWCSHNVQIKDFVYVNGHTHRNYFYDDGDYRIYADNQIGYTQKMCRLKYFYLEDDYDIFLNWVDGIHEISREQYIGFYRGKNLDITFNRNFHKLYLLKKQNTYMFVLQSSSNLNILNGGSLSKLEHKEINYYFENIDKVISYVKTPLDEFSKFQNDIADKIKQIGGSGVIHGAIIDINMLNHIYVNPIDGTVTPYWASDIIKKVVYKDFPTLLQSRCPEIYANYLRLIEHNSQAALILKSPTLTQASQFYLNTDIYKASREIKKMQKLNKNILSIWVEPQVKKLSNN